MIKSIRFVSGEIIEKDDIVNIEIVEEFSTYWFKVTQKNSPDILKVNMNACESYIHDKEKIH